MFFHLPLRERNIPHAKNWDGEEVGVPQRLEMGIMSVESGDFAIKTAQRKVKNQNPKVDLNSTTIPSAIVNIKY